MDRRVFLLLLSSLQVRSQSENYGYLSNCPGANQPLFLTDGFLNRDIFFKVQVNNPQAQYRRTYYYRNAIDGIGRDPNIDFKSKKTLVYMPGYMDSTSFILSRLAVLGYPGDQYNTITFDSLQLYSFIYPKAARCARQVGNITAILLHGLSKYGLRSEDIEVFGYSLGGQAAAFAAKNYYKLSGRRVGKITALDPAGPCFRNLKDPSDSLHISDADFVQVIHATGQGFGIDRAVGHIDFYINGGDYQYVLGPYQPLCDEVCAHTAALAYHHSNLKHPAKFVGVKCTDVQQAREHRCFENEPRETNFMGPNINRTKLGIYYVPVSAFIPFYPDEEVAKTKINYQILYDDAMSSLNEFVLSE